MTKPLPGPSSPWPDPEGHHCACGQPAPYAHTCSSCLDELHALLSEMPWLDDQLITAVSRQHGASYGGSSHSAGETPLPWNDRASKAARRLRIALERLLTRCQTAHVAHQSPEPGPPRITTITGLARWLDWRVDGLEHHAWTTAQLRHVTQAANAARSAALWKPQQRVFVGRCEGTPIDDDHLVSQPCPGEVHALEGALAGRCTSCGRSYAVDALRARMEAQLDDRLCTASEIARLSTYLSLDMSRDRVRQLVNLWHHRGRLRVAGHDPSTDPPRPMFRYGEVRELLEEARQAQAAKRAK